MENLRLHWYDTKGTTLIELMMTTAILSLVLVSLYSFLLMGNKIQNSAVTQSDLQRFGQKVLQEIIEGKSTQGTWVSGLREASKVTITGIGISFVVGEEGVFTHVTYYFEDGRIFYKDEATAGGDPSVIGSGGQVVLENVTGFILTEHVGENGRKLFRVTVQLEKALNSGGTNNITLSTEVTPRNLLPTESES